MIGVADFTFTFGEVVFNGIALGTIAAIVIYHLMRTIARLRGTAAPAERPGVSPR